MSVMEPHTEKLKYIFDNARVGIAICNAEDNKLEMVNPAFAAIHGYEPHELIGASPGEVFAPECMIRLEAHEQSQSCAINDVSFETTHIRKDGSPVPVSVHITVIKDENGVVKQRIANIIDISKRKNIEAELASRENEFRSLAENSPDIIARWDCEGRYLYINPVHERTLGKTLDEVIGTFIPDSHEVVKAAIAQVAATGIKMMVRQSTLNEKGEMEFHEVNIVAEQDLSGKIISVLGIGRDRTNFYRLQDELAEREKELRALADSSPGMMGSYYLRPDSSTCMPYVSPNIIDLFGITPEDVADDTNAISKLHHPDDNNKIFETLAESARTMSVWHEEFRIIHPSKGERWMESNTMPQSHPQGGIIWYGYIHDITERKRAEAALKSQSVLLQAVLESSPDVTIFALDREYNYLSFNHNHSAIMNNLWDCVITIGINMLNSITREEDKQKAKKLFDKALAGECFVDETEYGDETLSRSYWQTYYAPMVDANSEIIGLTCFNLNITERKKMESEIKKQKDFQNTLLLSIAEAGLGIHVIEDGKYVYTNDIEKAKRYGYDETIMDVKPNFLETIHPDDRAKALDMYTRRIRGEDVPSTYELGVIQTDGTRREHSVSVIVIPNTDPIQTIVVTQDITERKENEKKIYHMAHHDALTGLPNRTLAKIRAEQIMDQSKRYGTKVAFLFIDLDGFKEINDTLGHSIGDMMLKTIASRLKKFIRESDNISRQGGDEFLLILSDVQANNDIALIAKKILIKLEKPFVINSNTLSVSGSIGIATYPDHGDTFETLFQSADTAMYKAKESGKNSYHFYTQQMTHHMIGQFKIQTDLKTALEKDELILHYQPQIDLATNTITGVEALIRWRHPMLGMMPPMSFIPIAESSGLIVQIGQWVIEESCRQVALWHTKGIEVGVAVNISAMQFKRGNLEEIVKNAISSSQINPDRLELELTESIIMHDADNTLQSVRNLKALGVQLSIDDFGTGYSSLSYLKRFAVDKLKIDQSFVRDILQDRDDAAIVKTIIQMAKNLNLKTIAEGVENAQVLSVIETYGCDEVQGYHFAKPMEASAFESFYKSF